MLRHAGGITAQAYDEALSMIRPGVGEFDVQECLEHGYKTRGSRGTGYDTIVGGGLRSTILHYRANCETLEDGDLVCIDSAACYQGYVSDVTRTFPVNGVFSARQREVYSVVLEALEATIKAVKPGVTLPQLDTKARRIITKAGFGDYFVHSIGHHLGLEVHDVAPSGPLKMGAVVTIEPGIYLPEERLGVRIEDDIVVTKDGFRNLTGGIPKRISDIEKKMSGGRKSASKRQFRRAAQS